MNDATDGGRKLVCNVLYLEIIATEVERVISLLIAAILSV